MKLKRILIILMIMMIAAFTACFAACGSSGDEGGAEAAAEKTTGSDAEDADADEDTEDAEDPEDTEDAAGEAGQEGSADISSTEVVKTIDGIDTEDMNDLPLQIESITLFDDGSLMIVPTEDVLRNAESNDELVDGAMYPFADSGKVEDVYLVRYGNGGYRTIICLMDDGTLSAMSATELIEDRIAIVMDNMTGRDTYVSIKQTESEDGFSVVGITSDGQEIDLDYSLNF